MNNESEQIFLVNHSVNQTSNDTEQTDEMAETTQVNLENIEDFSNVCRTCATITEFVIPIFEEEGQQNTLADKIHKHLPIQVTEQDLLPRVVCYQCASTLLAWHELVQCCVQADAALKTRAAALEVEKQKRKSADVANQESTEDKEKVKFNSCRVTFQTYRMACRELNTCEPTERDLFKFNLNLETNQSLNASSIISNVTEEKHDALLQNNTSTIDDYVVKEEKLETILKNDDADRGSDIITTDLFSADDEQPLSCQKSNQLYENFYVALANFRNHFVVKHKQLNHTDTDSSEDDGTNEKTDAAEYDDLSNCNMRNDTIDVETRKELNQVQTKIDGKICYTCKICDKNLSSTHTYIFHKRIHTGERPCVCHICGKQFRSPSGLHRHLAETHERVRRLTCRVCAKSFANSQNLKHHMRIHTGERPFVCSCCGKRFTQSGTLHVHMKTHSDHFPYSCAECGAKFKLRSGLERHKLKHTGERPHVCAQCGKGFRYVHDLNGHTLSHTNMRPHTCIMCGAAFRQRKALRHHCKRVHEGDTNRVIIQPLVYTAIEH